MPPVPQPASSIERSDFRAGRYLSRRALETRRMPRNHQSSASRSNNLRYSSGSIESKSTPSIALLDVEPEDRGSARLALVVSTPSSSPKELSSFLRLRSGTNERQSWGKGSGRKCDHT